MLFSLTLEETKSLLKDLQNDKKKVLKGAKRDVFVGPKVVLEKRVQFLKDEYQNFHNKFESELQRAKDARNDTEPLKLYGFKVVKGYIREMSKSEYQGKYNDVELALWTEKTFPKFTDELWDIEFEEYVLIEHMKMIV